jgi:hypothetical protein
MPDLQLRESLITQIHSLLDKQDSPLAPILRRAIRLAVLCKKEEYKLLFDIHLDGIEIGKEGRIEKWKDKNKIPDWYPIDAFYEDRKVSDDLVLPIPVEEIEISLKNTTEIKDKLFANNKYKESESLVKQEKDLRLVLTRIRNRVALFLREIEVDINNEAKISESKLPPKVIEMKENSKIENDEAQNHLFYNLVKKHSGMDKSNKPTISGNK